MVLLAVKRKTSTRTNPYALICRYGVKAKIILKYSTVLYDKCYKTSQTNITSNHIIFLYLETPLRHEVASFTHRSCCFC